MFCYSRSSRIRRDILLAYREQSDSLKVTFKCFDGDWKCGEWALRFSKWFSNQLDACGCHGNKIEFGYTMYSKKCIKSFLDTMHGRGLKNISLITLLELLSFLLFEGKCGEYNIRMIKSL